MRITLCGAAGEVTGSGYLVETPGARVLVDFGMFQGPGSSRARNERVDPVVPSALNSVVLTHAHLDHSGRLPLVCSQGFTGAIHATAGTIELAELILTDSAHVQQADAERRNRRNERRGRATERPLYGASEVADVVSRMTAIGYGETRAIAPGISIRLLDAGHILGSASVEMTVSDAGAGRPRVVVFSGDIGQRNRPLLRDPVLPDRADLVFLESTYGDRDHRPIEATLAEFRALIASAVEGRHRVLIPAFSVGRSQLVLYYLAELAKEGVLGDPPVPVYLDSPMAIKATELYRTHVDLLDETEVGNLRTRGALHQLLTRGVRPLVTAEESRALNASWDPAIIIAGSGMCEGGRIQHHLKHHLWKYGTVVTILGYQGVGTLGRRLVEGAREVLIHGQRVLVRAKIATLGGFSAHADQSELADWLAPVASERPRVVLTHGEDRARSVLREVIRTRYGLDVDCPGPGASIRLDEAVSL